MNQQKNIRSFKILLDKAFRCSSLIILSLFCIENAKAQSNNVQVPGLAIARYALPSISANTENAINSTGTPVGLKVATLKKNLENIQNTSSSFVQSTRELYEIIITEVNQYYLEIGEIEAKLQLGTTPSNPTLMNLRNQAAQQLDKLAKTIAMMSDLSAKFMGVSQQAETLFSHTHALFHLPGAVDEDHAHLLFISGELEQLDRAIGQTLIIITTNIQRQNEWLGMERIRFANLEKSIERGQLESSVQRLPPQPVFPRPEPLPKLELPKKVHPTHKQHAPLKPEEIELGGKKETEANPLALTPPSQPSVKAQPEHPKKKEDMTKASHLSPLPSLPVIQEPKLPSPPLVQKEERAEESLPKVKIVSHPQIQIPEETESASIEKEQSSLAQEKEATNEKAIEYSAIVMDRTPLAVLEKNQDAKSQKWYLYSSIKRGIKTPQDVIEVIGVGDQDKGQEVKNILVGMGIKPEQLTVITVRGEPDHLGKIYFYSK